MVCRSANVDARLYATQFVAVLLALILGLAAACVRAQTPNNVVYKHVDAQGRVTYANSPIVGGARVELAPITVISFPNTKQAGGTANVSVPTKPVAEVAEPTQGWTRSQTGESAALGAQMRRDAVRKRILEAEIAAEEQLYADARSMLVIEKRRATDLRSKTSTPENIQELRDVLRAQFERVRQLQDQVEMHEQSLGELKRQLATPSAPTAGVAAGAPTEPIRTAATPAPVIAIK